MKTSSSFSLGRVGAEPGGGFCGIGTAVTTTTFARVPDACFFGCGMAVTVAGFLFVNATGGGRLADGEATTAGVATGAISFTRPASHLGTSATGPPVGDTSSAGSAAAGGEAAGDGAARTSGLGFAVGSASRGEAVSALRTGPDAGGDGSEELEGVGGAVFDGDGTDAFDGDGSDERVGDGAGVFDGDGADDRDAEGAGVFDAEAAAAFLLLPSLTTPCAATAGTVTATATGSAEGASASKKTASCGTGSPDAATASAGTSGPGFRFGARDAEGAGRGAFEGAAGVELGVGLFGAGEPTGFDAVDVESDAFELGLATTGASSTSTGSVDGTSASANVTGSGSSDTPTVGRLASAPAGATLGGTRRSTIGSADGSTAPANSTGGIAAVDTDGATGAELGGATLGAALGGTRISTGPAGPTTTTGAPPPGVGEALGLLLPVSSGVARPHGKNFGGCSLAPSSHLPLLQN